MAAVGRMAASVQSFGGSSDGSCPGIFPGQLPPRAARPTSTTWANFHSVGRCAAAPRPRTLRPSCPAIPRPRANLSPLLPSQVARSSSASPPTAGACRSEGVGSLPLPLPPPPTSPQSAEASRVRCARAVHVHMCCVCMCISPLTDSIYSTLTTTAANSPREHTIPCLIAIAYHVPADVQSAAAPPQHTHECMLPHSRAPSHRSLLPTQVTLSS